jgi:hypothetical protein
VRHDFGTIGIACHTFGTIDIVRHRFRLKELVCGVANGTDGHVVPHNNGTNWVIMTL